MDKFVMVPVKPTKEMIYWIAIGARRGDSGEEIWSEALAFIPKLAFHETAERAAFEDWAFTRWPTIRRLRINRPGSAVDGEYELEGLQAAWQGYLACARSKADVQ